MVLGTALSAIGSTSGSATAATETPEAISQAVNNISRYCTTCWRNARLHPECWSDCTQEVFRRLLERVPADDWDRVCVMRARSGASSFGPSTR